MTVSAYDLGFPINDGQTTFGMDRQKTAATLRFIADRIENGDFILNSGGVYTQARVEDYTMTVLNLKFHEQREKEPLKAMSA